MTMHLSVPLIKQEKESVDCGITCVAMILEYYNKGISFDECKKHIKTYDIGTFMPQLGSFLLDNGFAVEMITLNPFLFTKAQESLSQEEIKKHVKNLFEQHKDDKLTESLEWLMTFLDKGGSIKVKVPSFDEVKEEIDNERPMLALLSSNVVTANIPRFNFHSNVITGYDDKSIFVNDPLWDERGGKKEYAKNDFFYALFASAFGDSDNASLLRIIKK